MFASDEAYKMLLHPINDYGAFVWLHSPSFLPRGSMKHILASKFIFVAVIIINILLDIEIQNQEKKAKTTERFDGSTGWYDPKQTNFIFGVYLRHCIVAELQSHKHKPLHYS